MKEQRELFLGIKEVGNHKKLLALNIDYITLNVNYRKFQGNCGSRELWLSYAYSNLK